jgi:hypothetical protein
VPSEYIHLLVAVAAAAAAAAVREGSVKAEVTAAAAAAGGTGGAEVVGTTVDPSLLSWRLLRLNLRWICALTTVAVATPSPIKNGKYVCS